MKHAWRSRPQGGYRCKACEAVRVWIFGEQRVVYPDGREVRLSAIEPAPECLGEIVPRVRGAR